MFFLYLSSKINRHKELNPISFLFPQISITIVFINHAIPLAPRSIPVPTKIIFSNLIFTLSAMMLNLILIHTIFCNFINYTESILECKAFPNFCSLLFTMLCYYCNRGNQSLLTFFLQSLPIDALFHIATKLFCESLLSHR